MMRVWQAAALAVFWMSGLQADEAPRKIIWDPPKVTASAFSQDLGMLDPERDEYATNLATYAANRVALDGASAASLAEARKILALALHLSPRNRRAVVVSFQLAKGVIPETTRGDYAPQTLARLLLTRGQLLEKQGGAENLTAARTFIDLAASMDPKNEDAVYASEMLRLDRGQFDWSALTDPQPAAPAESDDSDNLP
jgi:hypothetical protein